MSSATASMQTSAVSIPVGAISVAGDLVVPARSTGIVVFAHGSGSSRLSPRNRFVAGELQKAGLATLLMDLLTTEEELIDEMRGGALRFDIGLLAERLQAVSEWLAAAPLIPKPSICYFGASTGAAAALLAAAKWHGDVRAVVSRGGRPDLATTDLPKVKAPTLLIVGGADHVVIDLNREAMELLRCEKRLEIVPGASHLFEEPGTLERVAALAAGWFTGHLRAPTPG